MPDAELLAELKRLHERMIGEPWGVEHLTTGHFHGLYLGTVVDEMKSNSAIAYYEWDDKTDPETPETIADVRCDLEGIAALRNLLPRIIAALTPGGAVVGCHTASEADHDRPPGSERV